MATREELVYYANKVLKLQQEGKLKVRYHRQYSLEEIQQAHKDLEGRKTMGKLLIRL